MATAFSEEQDVELLAVLDRMILLAAAGKSAVSSTMETTLPAPTVWQGFPAPYTTLISAAPPVAITKSTFFMSSWVFSFEGSFTHWKRSSGAPIFLRAFLAISTAI